MKLRVFALILFGISFGYLEAAVVVYLRTIYEPIRQQIAPRPKNELFPLITPEQLAHAGPENTRRLLTEIGREAATLVMLASMGLAVGNTVQQRVAAFLVAFGIWDIFFYIFLRVLIGWPDSLFTWDLLFLIPVPWVGPVLAPIIVAMSMVAGGLYVLQRPVQIGPINWGAALLGAIVIVIAFCLDYPNVTAGGLPHPFHWNVFAAGALIAWTGFLTAVIRRRRSAP
jgi:hypothetical protein